MVAGVISKLPAILVIFALIDNKVLCAGLSNIPKDFYPKDNHGLGADGLISTYIGCEYILLGVRVVIKRHNVQSQYTVSFALVKQSKHGSTCLALPSTLP